jgi:coenzyme PQQ precursor peptide PqqA
VTKRSATHIKLAREHKKKQMTWTTPTLLEICIGLEINGYLPAEFLIPFERDVLRPLGQHRAAFVFARSSAALRLGDVGG